MLVRRRLLIPGVACTLAVGVAAVGVAGLLGKWVYDYYNKKPSSEAENKENKKQKHCNR